MRARCLALFGPGPLLAACVLALLPVTGSNVSAHPLGNFTVNRYSRVEVRGDGIHIRYVLDLAEIPSVQESQLADLNHDGVVSADEWDAYRKRRLEEIRANLELTVDGTPVQLQTDPDPEKASVSTPMGQADIPLIRIEAWFNAGWQLSPGDTSSHSAAFRDRNEPARLGWREIVVRGNQSMSVSNSSVPTIDTTDELRSYPERFLQDPLDVREARWIFAAGGMTGLPTTPVPQGASQSGSDGRPVDPFTALVTAADLNLGVVLLALAGAAALGGIHAASPGHGKTVMAAYIVGTRGGFVHAVVLGLSVTVSHTFGVLVLGAITLLASNLILPERLYPWLTMVAALIVLALGVTLLVGAVRGLGRERSAHQHAHDHDHPHTHTHAHEHEHEHARKLPITWRSLFMLGLAGGIVPSASALVVLLSALALGRLGFGLLLIVAFGFGMAVVLITTGVLLVTASRFMSRYFPDDAHSPLQRLFSRAVPLVSAGIMVLIGVIAALQALGQFGILAFF